MSTIPELVSAADGGDAGATRELFAALYQELHALAEHHLRRRGSHLTISTTTLLHEAYLRLSERDGARFPDRQRFLAYASKAMRGLVIDYARARRARKRGGGVEITRLDDERDAGAAAPDADLERLGDAMERLTALDAELAQLVDLHFFAGFSLVEIAALRGSSERTVQRDWRKARALLQRVAGDA
jgi:RNA polymerase sigma factor (TIGR02999 family)